MRMGPKRAHNGGNPFISSASAREGGFSMMPRYEGANGVMRVFNRQFHSSVSGGGEVAIGEASVTFAGVSAAPPRVGSLTRPSLVGHTAQREGEVQGRTFSGARVTGVGVSDRGLSTRVVTASSSVAASTLVSQASEPGASLWFRRPVGVASLPGGQKRLGANVDLVGVLPAAKRARLGVRGPGVLARAGWADEGVVAGAEGLVGGVTPVGVEVDISGDLLLQEALGLATTAVAPSTSRAYAASWSRFEGFCVSEGVTALPSTRETVGRFIAWRVRQGAGGSVSRDLAAIRSKHIERGFSDPCADPWVQRVGAGAKRGAAASRMMGEERLALPVSAVEKLLEIVPVSLGIRAGEEGSVSTQRQLSQVLALRDAAIISLGLRLMRRGGELAAIKLTDVEARGDGITVTIRQSKTDQLGVGLRLPVEPSGAATCPVSLLQRWLVVRHVLVARGRGTDSLFVSSTGTGLSTGAVASIVRRAAAAAGLEGRFSAHSLRIGGATAALGAGASLAMIQSVGGWSSDAVHRYLRPASAASSNLTAAMGL